MILPIVVTLLLLHTADGREVRIAPEHMVALTSPPEVRKGTYSSDVQCLINLSDGKFVGVKETCDSIRDMVEKQK